MNILVAHNYYRWSGGEDIVFESEVDQLLSAGHNVFTLKISNSDIKTVLEKAGALLGTASNRRGIDTVLKSIRECKPDLVHFHNTFPLLSPAVYGACRAMGVAVVQTLHNFRPICPGSLLFRDGQDCRLCVNGSSLPGVFNRCYRNSFVASAAAAHMVSVHRRRGTWCSDVDQYVALTEFSKNRFVDAGFPADRIEVKPNSVIDPGPPGSGQRRSGVLYVGRLSPEKGVATLVQACRELDCQLRIVGSGPDLASLRAHGGSNVTFLGTLDRKLVLREMQRADVVAVPSVCSESFPMVVAEAFACGTPVVASHIGALGEIVEDGVTGALVPPGDPAVLHQKLASLLSDPDLMGRLGASARRVFVERYTAAANLRRLEDIYARAQEHFDAEQGRFPCGEGEQGGPPRQGFIRNIHNAYGDVQRDI